MQHHRFLSRLLNRPQFITAAAGAVVLQALMPSASLIGWDGAAVLTERDVRAYSVVDGTAVIPIVGELVHRGGMMDAMSGLTSYEALGDMVSDALSDPAVGAILLDVDSPGGEAAGCLDFAEWLAAQRGTKPIWAQVNQQACSAAYAIASAADRILIGEDGDAGSIGVVAYHTDVSAALVRAGVKITYLYAGDRKIDGAPTAALSDPARAAWQEAIDGTYARFCSVVAANRGLSVSAVTGTQAAILRGRDAVAAGLADNIATPDLAMRSIAGAQPGIPARKVVAAATPALAKTVDSRAIYTRLNAAGTQCKPQPVKARA